jgi:hypothetical protein
VLRHGRALPDGRIEKMRVHGHRRLAYRPRAPWRRRGLHHPRPCRVRALG